MLRDKSYFSSYFPKRISASYVDLYIYCSRITLVYAEVNTLFIFSMEHG